MYETIRIVGKLRPKYVMWENVKNLLSKSHKHNFDAYIETMNVLGYNSYYQVLNAKDYGIPQNRERVYTVSIRKDIDNENFVFPDKEDLVLRLKDMLEDKVDEKYYLSDDKVSKIEKSNFMQEKKRIQDKEYSDTILARDYKDPKCVRVGGIFDTENSKHQAGSIYNKEGLAPTLDAMQGGWRQPSIIEETIVAGQFQPKDRDYNKKGLKREEQFECRKDELSNAILTNEKKNCILEINKSEDKLPGAYGRNFGSKGKLQDTEGTCDTLQAAMGNGGGNVPIIELKSDCKRLKSLIEKTQFEEGKVLNLDLYNQTTNENISQCLTEPHHNTQRLFDGFRIRKLTPKECWRLMGFDDEDFDRAEKVNSNTQLYKQARKFNRCKCIRKNTC